jgi:predicted nucleic acid-binding protein
MIVLDTHVVSEPTKLRGDPTVQAWLDRQVADTLYLTATSLAELLWSALRPCPMASEKRGSRQD